MVGWGLRRIEYEKDIQQGEYGSIGQRTKKNVQESTVSEGGVTQEEIERMLGRNRREGAGQKLQGKSDRSSWNGREGQGRVERVKSSQ